MVNINPDGKFEITSGGITQGIKRELGLTDEQCRMLGSIWTQVINEFDNPENMKVTNNKNTSPDKSNNYTVHAGAVIEFSKECWNRIVGWINNALKTNIQTNEESVQNTDSSGAVSNSSGLSQDVSEILTGTDFQYALEKSVPEEYKTTVKDWLNPSKGKITVVDEDNGGAARYDSNSGKIIISKKYLQSADKGDLIKVLTHEAMHAAQNSSFNTQEEELLCEMTAIKTRAALAEKDTSKDGTIYGKKYSELGKMSDTELKEHLQKNFIGDQTEGHYGVGAYSNRIIDKTGAVTIHSANGSTIPLKSGSKITVGNETYTLGQDVYIEGVGAFAGTTCQMFKLVNGKPVTIGMISFDNTTPLPMESQYQQVKEHNEAINNNQYETGSIKSDDKTYSFKITDYSS